MNLPRSSGVQLHLTSLPGGRMGPAAFRFVDWLQAAGQSWWQTLPLGPPDRARSPYNARSAFACWPGLLADPAAPVTDDEIEAFCVREAFWIGGWAAMAGGRRAVADQVRFEREWTALRAYAAEAGVRLIGDVPIYVASGGADHRAWPELFRPGDISGAPPDAYSETGQLWGNPLFDWPALQARGYRWWVERLRRTFAMYDVTRIDHFRGFVAYWAVPAHARDARAGRWVRGPGAAVFRASERALGELPVIAEDLGVITPPVHRLRRELSFPGMSVLQFAFDAHHGPDSPMRVANFSEDSVAYTGTHDQDTLPGWWAALPQDMRVRAGEAIAAAGVRERDPVWSLIALGASTRSRLSMVQIPDVLGLGSEARMNIPGRATGSWRWQMAEGALTRALARRLRSVTEEHRRL